MVQSNIETIRPWDAFENILVERGVLAALWFGLKAVREYHEVTNVEDRHQKNLKAYTPGSSAVLSCEIYQGARDCMAARERFNGLVRTAYSEALRGR